MYPKARRISRPIVGFTLRTADCAEFQRRDVSLLTCVNRHPSYTSEAGGYPQRNTVSNFQIGAEGFSRSRNSAKIQTPDVLKIEAHFYRRVRHAFVAPRIVAGFNFAI